MPPRRRKPNRKTNAHLQSKQTKDSSHNSTSAKEIAKSAIHQAKQNHLPNAWICSLSIFFMGLIVYNINGDFTSGRDITANLYMPIIILQNHSLVYTPTDFPNLFVWIADTPNSRQKGQQGEVVLFKTWNSPVEFKSEKGDFVENEDGITAQEMTKQGTLYLQQQRYLLTPSKNITQGFVNTFGIGTGITFLPPVALVRLYDGNFHRLLTDHWFLVYLGKFWATVLVSASGVMVFLTADQFTCCPRMHALVVSFCYLFSTCVWSISSQQLWQHPANEFYLSIAIFCFVKMHYKLQHGSWSGWKEALLLGLMLAMATMCRPTSAIVVIVIGLYLLYYAPRQCILYALAGLPLGLAQLYYNNHHFGSPFEFGQSMASRIIAEVKTGSNDLWQTPLLTGMMTLLFSPARGLFFFSPFTIFPCIGFPIFWRNRSVTDTQKEHDVDPGLKALLPLILSMLLLWCVQFKFFDYWGGWCFGYRPLVDTMPIVCILLTPIMKYVFKNKPLLVVFLICVAFSIFVQILGTFAYNQAGWNYTWGVVCKKNGQFVSYIGNAGQSAQFAIQRKYPRTRGYKFTMEHMNIDLPKWRGRLWDYQYNPISYYFYNFWEARVAKAETIKEWVEYLK